MQSVYTSRDMTFSQPHIPVTVFDELLLKNQEKNVILNILLKKVTPKPKSIFWGN